MLPASAQLFGDESWELLTANDLWAPFDATLGVLPATPALPPTTLGAHYDTPGIGVHEHRVEAMTARSVAATDYLFCWVYLDPVDPPREIMLQWQTDANGWKQSAYWGWNLLASGTLGDPAPMRAGDLPQPGQWTRLQISVAEAGLTGKITGVAFTQFDGFAAFGASGSFSLAANGAAGAENVWFAGTLPAPGSAFGNWNFLSARDMYAPSPASQSGQVQALSDLYADASLQMLSAQERAQLYLLGIHGFADYLKSRADRADDLVDYGFVKVQTDVYRIRQLMLGSTAATRLAVSPALASIAQAETSTASQTQIASFITGLKLGDTSTSNDTGALKLTRSANIAKASNSTAAASTSAASNAAAAPQASIALGGLSSGISSNLGNIGAISSGLNISTGINLPVINLTPIVSTSTLQVPSKVVSRASDITLIAPTRSVSLTPSPIEVANASPLAGTSFVRTTTIAQRLEDPKSKEARDYSTSSRYEAVLSLLRLADNLSAEDGGAVPGLFDGVDLHGLEGDTFLQTLPGETTVPTSRPIAQFINPATRAVLLPKLLSVPTRTVLGAATDPDESAYFSDSTDLSDHVVAMMRKLEGRIKMYRDAVTVCQQVLTGLQAAASSISSTLGNIADDLAEARHDVSVARSLLDEETQRIDAINARRAQVLVDEVKFIAYIRPRETDNLLTTPTHSVDPGLLDAPVPACLAEHPNVAEELLDMLRVVNEAPANWFVKLPPIVQKLDKVEPLVRMLQTAQVRAVSGIATPVMTSASSGISLTGKVGTAIANVAARQVEALAPRINALQTLNIASLASTTWQGIQTQAVQVVSFGDLAEGGHGRADVSKAAATELQNIRSIVACLHAGFSQITPVLRLEWAETLSEFDAAPNLRNLANLSRWAEIDYIDRTQMQGYVNWLFAQIEPGQSQAVALINDVIRMCLLLASHAPVDRIITGRLAKPLTGVSPGLHVPLVVVDPSKLRVGMQALFYKDDAIVARAQVADIGQLQVSAQISYTSAAKVDLGDDIRIHFDEAASISLSQASAKRTLFGR